MAEEGSTPGNTSFPSASTNQMPRAAPSRGSECPICLDIIKDQVSVSWCRHTFCFSCILEWSCIKPICPQCHEPFQYLFRKVGDNNYEVYYITSARPDPERRAPHRSVGRRRHRSTGRRQRSSPSRDRRTSRASARERERSRSRGYDSSSSSRQHQSRAQDTSSDTSSDEDQASRSEQDVPVRRGRSERYQQGRRVSSRVPQATRSRSRRRPHSPDGHRDR